MSVFNRNEDDGFSRDTPTLIAYPELPGTPSGNAEYRLEESDGLKLRVVRSVATADMTGMVGMVKAPARGVPRRLEDFDPSSLLTRSRRGKS